MQQNTSLFVQGWHGNRRGVFTSVWQMESFFTREVIITHFQIYIFSKSVVFVLKILKFWNRRRIHVPPDGDMRSPTECHKGGIQCKSIKGMHAAWVSICKIEITFGPVMKLNICSGYFEEIHKWTAPTYRSWGVGITEEKIISPSTFFINFGTNNHRKHYRNP